MAYMTLTTPLVHKLDLKKPRKTFSKPELISPQAQQTQVRMYVHSEAARRLQGLSKAAQRHAGLVDRDVKSYNLSTFSVRL